MNAQESLQLLWSAAHDSWMWGWNVYFVAPGMKDDLPPSAHPPVERWWLGEKKGHAREMCMLCMKDRDRHTAALLRTGDA